MREGGRGVGGERTEMGQVLLCAWSHLEFRIIILQKYLRNKLVAATCYELVNASCMMHQGNSPV